MGLDNGGAFTFIRWRFWSRVCMNRVYGKTLRAGIGVVGFVGCYGLLFLIRDAESWRISGPLVTLTHRDRSGGVFLWRNLVDVGDSSLACVMANVARHLWPALLVSSSLERCFVFFDLVFRVLSFLHRDEVSWASEMLPLLRQ